MKKVGIVTLFGNYNYGNRLQNYAVQELVKNRGYKPITLVFETSLIKKWYRMFKARMVSCKALSVRTRALDKFNKEKIDKKNVYAPKGKVFGSLKNKYTFFVVGSDQVWNPEIRRKERSIFFLEFAHEKQRICISPSIGVSSISEEYAGCYRRGLNGFSKLCCREEDGCKEIQRLSNKTCERLIDPTMALSSKKWREFAAEYPVKINHRFIICFFLGKMPENVKDIIEQYAKQKSLIIYNISNIDCEYYGADPRELVGLIDKSELVFTDSFHITAFSINLNKNFWVFDRNDNSVRANHINSRIKTLTNLFELRERYIDANFSLDDIEKKCCFEKANSVLDQERTKFYNYINDVLNEEKNET